MHQIGGTEILECTYIYRSNVSLSSYHLDARQVYLDNWQEVIYCYFHKEVKADVYARPFYPNKLGIQVSLCSVSSNLRTIFFLDKTSCS